MDLPLVSIVVISFNHSKFLIEVLESVKEQTYSNFELIIVDDASTDDSVSIIEQWAFKNNIDYRNIFHKKNTGVATILNESISICNGTYIKLMAADDFMHTECLAKLVNCLQEKGYEYGIAFSDTYCIDENSNPLPDMADYDKLGNISAEEFRTELIKGNRIAAVSVLMRTDVLKETGKYDSKFIVEDYYRWLKINEKYLIAYIPEKLTYYRLHAENISKTKAERINIETIMLQIMFDKTGIMKDKINGYLQNLYLSKKETPKDLLTLFSKYPFARKRLKFFMQYQIPPIAYRAICKFI